MSRPTPLALLAALALACAARPLGNDSATDGAATTTTGEPTTTTPADPTTSTTTSTPTTTGPSPSTTTTTDQPPATSGASDPATAGCAFLGCALDMPVEEDCDGWNMPDQDCPEGQKCTFDGDLFESHCIDIVPDPKGLYEPCHVSAGADYDDCGPGLVCWWAEDGVGICLGVCQGPIESATCADPNITCNACSDCALGFCLPPECHPLTQDCPDGQTCIPFPGYLFHCTVRADGANGGTFDACDAPNTCGPGLTCADPALATECDPMAAGCCLPFCDLTNPTCPGDGLTCVPWYEPGLTPPGLENVGLCGLAP